MIRLKVRKAKVSRIKRERRPRAPRPVHTEAQDIADLAAFGYQPELGRSLGRFSSFAAGFSYLSILTGTTQTFFLGYGLGGPAFFWTWPLVFLGQFTVALCFAELATHYPLAGGVYQWSKHTTGGRLGWLAGWIFLGCLIVSLVAVTLALQSTLPQLIPALQVVGDSNTPADAAKNAVLLGLGLVGFSTVINALGVKLMARLNNFGVFTELLGATILIGLLFFLAKRGPEVVLIGSKSVHPFGAFLAASLSASYVMYGFDTAGTLAEETRNPRRTAPRAILWALGSAATFGILLVLAGLMAANNLDGIELTSPSGGLTSIVMDRLGGTVGRLFLAVIALAITVCALAVHTGAVRLIFAMARDNVLPGSRFLSVVNGPLQIPARAAGVVGLIAAALLLMNLGQPKIIELAASVSIVWANLAYLMVTVPLLLQRFKGWPAENEAGSEFRLGRWGLPLNLIAVVWGIGLVVNVAWPRAEIYGDGWAVRYAPMVSTFILIVSGLVVHAFRPQIVLRRGVES